MTKPMSKGKGKLDRKFYEGIAWFFEELGFYAGDRQDEFYTVFGQVYKSRSDREVSFIKRIWRENNPDIYKETIKPLLKSLREDGTIER